MLQSLLREVPSHKDNIFHAHSSDHDWAQKSVHSLHGSTPCGRLLSKLIFLVIFSLERQVVFAGCILQFKDQSLYNIGITCTFTLCVP